MSLRAVLVVQVLGFLCLLIVSVSVSAAESPVGPPLAPGYQASALLPSSAGNSTKVTDQPCAVTAGTSYPLIIQVYKAAAGYLSSIQTFYNLSGTICDGQVWGLSNGTRQSACSTATGDSIQEVTVYFDPPPTNYIYQLLIRYTSGTTCQLGDQLGSSNGVLQFPGYVLGYFDGYQIVNNRPTAIQGQFYQPTNSSKNHSTEALPTLATKWYQKLLRLN